MNSSWKGVEIIMITKKNNFLSSYIGLTILFLPLLVESKEFDYEFHWLLAPVARLSINFNESSTLYNKINQYEVKFLLSTEGPLKLYRNYSSQVTIKKNDDMSWDYFLFGQDRGQPEEKQITYLIGKAPIIKKFIDDNGVSPIIVNSIIDKYAMDPFSVLLKTI